MGSGGDRRQIQEAAGSILGKAETPKSNLRAARQALHHHRKAGLQPASAEFINMTKKAVCKIHAVE